MRFLPRVENRDQLFHDCIFNYVPFMDSVQRVDRSRMGAFRTFTETGTVSFGHDSVGPYHDYPGADHVAAGEHYSADNCSSGITIQVEISAASFPVVAIMLGKPYAATHTSPFFDWLMALTSGNLGIRMGASTWTPVSSLSTGTRYHFVFTADGTNWLWYQDGQQTNSLSRSNLPANTNSRPIRVGSNADGNEIFDGKLYSARVWPRALSPGEIERLYAYDSGELQPEDYNNNIFLFPTSAGGAAQTGTSAETLNISDTTSGIATAAGTSSELVNISDTTSGIATAAGTSSETLNLSDSTAGSVAYDDTSSETLNVSDTVTGDISIQAASVESVDISDTTSSVAAAAGTSAETLSISDSVSGVATALATSADVINISDVSTSVVPGVQAASSAENITFSDSVVATTGPWVVQANAATVWTVQ